jgi:hypothetical protein
MILELLLFGVFFVHFLSYRPESASRSWYFTDENQLILFCGAVAYAKIEISPAEESGNPGVPI